MHVDCATWPTWWESIRELMSGAWFSNWSQNPLPSVFSSSQGLSLSLYLGEFPERKWPAVFMYRLICLCRSADNSAEGFWYTSPSPLGLCCSQGKSRLPSTAASIAAASYFSLLFLIRGRSTQRQTRSAVFWPHTSSGHSAAPSEVYLVWWRTGAETVWRLSPL